MRTILMPCRTAAQLSRNYQEQCLLCHHSSVSKPPIVRASNIHRQLPQRRFVASFLLRYTDPVLKHSATDLQQAISLVQKHDPAGHLPGRLLPTGVMQLSYFAVRAFWIETSLRFSKNTQTPRERLDWWHAGIHQVFAAHPAAADHRLSPEYQNNATLRLLRAARTTQAEQHGESLWQLASFDVILNSRRVDLDVTQYDTVADLVHHAEQSCAELTRLVLQSAHRQPSQHPASFAAARCVGVGHGLTNALRLSIPVLSTTGKLIVPADLCRKYGVQSPRYLLSALGQGDDECQRALLRCVQELAETAGSYFHQARQHKSDILREHHNSATLAATASSVLLPGLACETFLERLGQHQFDLTDRSLRQVNLLEHWRCAARMMLAAYRNDY